jgi:hypothetical protein
LHEIIIDQWSIIQNAEYRGHSNPVNRRPIPDWVLEEK